ncbi:P2Y purinoceptor 6-like [Conger conger]|uniref:P2Y purinoceptor 6-like n=1 Tax=Conger conger TaxID=82655 RepID=UPI002A5A6585|nr:P2Y purinoceptor 6-like [Conger conger]
METLRRRRRSSEPSGGTTASSNAARHRMWIDCGTTAHSRIEEQLGKRTFYSLPDTMEQWHRNDSLLRAIGEVQVLQDMTNRSSQFCSQYRDAAWYCYLLLALYALALPVGVVGNVAALLHYGLARRCWTSSRVLLLNLALCDSAWLLTLPFALYFSLRRARAADYRAFCQFKRVSFNVNVYGSILFLTLVSFDRYAGAAHPLGSLRWWGAERARLCSGLAWTGLVLWAVPDLLLLPSGEARPGNSTACMDHMRGPPELVQAVTVARTVLGFGVPFALMLVFYALTVRALRSLPRGGKRQRASRPLALISAALAVFVVSFVPYHAAVLTVVAMQDRGSLTSTNMDSLYAAYELFEALCSVSSALDPLLYVLASERFPRGCRSLRRGPGPRAPALCCLRSRRVGPRGDAAP